MLITNLFSGKYKLVERPDESHEGVGWKKRLSKQLHSLRIRSVVLFLTHRSAAAV